MLIFPHESKLKRHKQTHNEDHFQKHEQNCQNMDFSFSINKSDDFIPSFIGESCFYSNRNGIVSNDPLDNSESIGANCKKMDIKMVWVTISIS